MITAIIIDKKPSNMVIFYNDKTNKHPQTTINANGLLTVNAEEPLNSLTVRATSIADNVVGERYAGGNIVFGGSGTTWSDTSVSEQLYCIYRE